VEIHANIAIYSIAAYARGYRSRRGHVPSASCNSELGVAASAHPAAGSARFGDRYSFDRVSTIPIRGCPPAYTTRTWGRRVYERMTDPRPPAHRGLEVFIGRHRLEADYKPQVDQRHNRAFFRLVDKIFRRVLARCAAELAATGAASRQQLGWFNVASRGGLRYAPGRLTMEWAALAEPGADGSQSEHEHCHEAAMLVFALEHEQSEHAQCRLRPMIPYEDYLASELILLYMACHEGYDHVRALRTPARPPAVTPRPPSFVIRSFTTAGLPIGA
jgi:hypothetical protein